MLQPKYAKQLDANIRELISNGGSSEDVDKMASDYTSLFSDEALKKKEASKRIVPTPKLDLETTTGSSVGNDARFGPELKTILPKVDSGESAKSVVDKKALAKSKRVKELEKSFYDSTKDDTDDSVAEQRLQDRKNNKGFWNTAEDLTKSAYNTVIDAMSSTTPILSGLQKAKISEDPLADEKKQALQEAKKNKITLSEIQKNARAEEIFKQKEKDNLFIDRANSFLDNLDVNDKDILQQDRLEKAVHLKLENQKKINVVSAMEIVGNEKIKEYQNVEKQLLSLNEKNQEFPKDLYDKYVGLSEEIKQIGGNIEKYSDQIQKNKSDLGTAEQEFDLFKRGYGDVDNFIGNAIATTGELANGIFGAVNYLASFSPDPIARLNSLRGQKVASKISGSLEEYRGALRKPVESVESAEGLVNYASDLVANQLPILAITSTGAGGLAVLGASTTGQTFTKINEEVLSGKANYSSLQMASIPLLQGGFEVISEIPTLSILKKGSRVISAAAKGEVDLIKKSGAEVFKGYSKDFGKEFGGEHITNLGQNFNAKYVQGKDEVGLLDNTGRVSKDTAFLTTLLQGSPHVFGAVAKVFQSNNDLGTLDENSRKIIEFSKQLNTEGLTDTEKTVIQKQIDKATSESSNIVANTIGKIGEMPNPVYDEILSLNSQAGKIKAEAKEIQDGKLPNKKELLVSLGQDYKELQIKRSGLVDGSITAFDLLSGKEQANRLTQASREIIKRDNPDGTKEKFEVKPEDAKKLANENYLKEIKEKENEQNSSTPTTETQPQAEVPQQAEAEKVATPPVEDVVATSVENIKNNGLKINGVTSIEFEDNNETILYGTKNNRTRISIKGMSKEQIQEEYDFDKQVFDKNKNRDFESEEIEIKKSIGLTDNEKISALKELKSSKRYNDILENITLPFYENKLNEATPPTNTPTNGNVQLGASNVGESGNAEPKTPAKKSVPSSVDGGEVKGDASVGEIKPKNGAEELKGFDENKVNEIEKKSKNNTSKVPDGKGSWRKAFNEEKDVFKKSAILRRVAEKTTSKSDLLDIKEASKGMPEESNILHTVERKLKSVKGDASVGEKAKTWRDFISYKETQKIPESIQKMSENQVRDLLANKKSKLEHSMTSRADKERLKYEVWDLQDLVIAYDKANEANKLANEMDNFDFAKAIEDSKNEKPLTEAEIQAEKDKENDEWYQKSSFDKKWAKTYKEAKGKLLDKIKESESIIKEWEAKVYKKGAGNKFVGGELEGKTVNLDRVNENRREKVIKNAKQDIADAKKDLKEMGISENEIKPAETPQPKSKGDVGKIIEPHSEVNTDVETVKKELKLNEVESLVYDSFKDIPKYEIIDKVDDVVEKWKDDKYGEIEAIESKINDIDIKIEDNGDAIDKINDDETISPAKTKKAIAVLEKEFKDLQKQQKELEEQKEAVNESLKQIDDVLFHPTEDYNIDLINEVVDKVNNRLETRKSIKEGTNLFPEDANIPEFVAVKKELIKLTDEKTIADFNSRTAEQVKESEPIIADIKSKAKNAERISKEELEKGIADAEKLLENKPTTKEKIAERIKLSDAKVDDWKNAVKDIDSIFGIKIKVDDIEGLNKNGIDIVEVIANIAKQAIAAGIHIDEAISKTIEHLKKTIDFDVNIDEIKERINPKKEAEKDFKREKGKSSVLKRIREGGNSPEINDIIDKIGLNYEGRKQEQVYADGVNFVKEVGVAEAYNAIKNGELKDSDTINVVYATILQGFPKMAENEISKVTDPQELSDLVKELDDLHEKIYTEFKSKTIDAGRGSAILNFIYNQDLKIRYSLSQQIENFKKVNNGVVPPETLAKMKELDKQYQEANKRIEELETLLQEAQEQKDFENIVDEEKRNGNFKYTQEDFDKELQKSIDNIKNDIKNEKKSLANKKREDVLTPKEKSRKQELRNKYFRANDITSIPALLVDPEFREYLGLVLKQAKGDFKIFSKEMLDTLGKVAKTHLPDLFKEAQNESSKKIGKLTVDEDDNISIPNSLIRSLVEQGFDDIKKLTSKILSDNKEEFPELTERKIRDAITKYGKTVEPNNVDPAPLIRKIKRAGKAISAIEDIAKGIRPKRSGLQRDKLDPEERRILRDINESMKNLPLDKADLSKHLKTALDAIKTRLSNHIEDLNKQIAEGKKWSKDKSSIELDQDAKDLVAKRDSLKIALDELVNVPKTEDEIYNERIASKLAEREKVLQGLIEGKKNDPTGRKSDWSAEISKVNTEISRLREKQKAIQSQKTPDEIYQKEIEAKINSLQKRIDDVKTGKVKDTEGNSSVWNSEISTLETELKNLKDGKKVVNNPKVKATVDKNGKVRIPAEMIKDFISKGGTDLSEFAKQVQESIKDEFPDVTVRDIRESVANYGKKANKSRPQIVEDIQKLKSEERLRLEYEDLQNRITKEKNEIRKRELSQTQKRLKEQIKQLQDNLGITEEERTNRSVNYTKKRIEQLREKIKNNDFAKKEIKPIVESPELKQAKIEKNRIQEEFDYLSYQQELENRTLRDKIKQFGSDMYDSQRVTLATGEMSFVGAQGGLYMVDSTFSRKTLKNLIENFKGTTIKDWKSNPIGTAFKVAKSAHSAESLIKMFNTMGTANNYVDFQRLLKEDANYDVYLKSGLRLLGEDVKSQVKDDNFIGNNILTLLKIPIHLTDRIEKKELLNFKLKLADEAKKRTTLQGYYEKLKTGKISDKNKKTATEIFSNTNPLATFERGNSVFMNMARVEMFNKYAAALYASGKNPIDHLDDFKKLASAVNTVTGSGNMNQTVTMALPILNKLMFSARYFAASWNLTPPMSLYYLYKLGNYDNSTLENPKTWKNIKATPAQKAFVKPMVKGFIAFYAASLFTMAMINAAIDDDDEMTEEEKAKKRAYIEYDPRSSDWMQVVSGNVRTDYFGPYRGNVVLMSKLLSGQTKTKSGEIIENGSKFGSRTDFQIATEYLAGKSNPFPGMFIRYSMGKKEEVTNEETGEKENRRMLYDDRVGIDYQIKHNTIPIFAKTVGDVFKEDPVLGAEFYTALALFGKQTNVYQKSKNSKKNSRGRSSRSGRRNR